MATKNKSDFNLTMKVLSDYSTKGKTSEVCPYCGKPLYKETAGASYSILCGTKDCYCSTFRGI